MLIFLALSFFKVDFNKYTTQWPMQGHNQVCSQRWARLENSPPPHNKFPFGHIPNKFQWFQKVTSKKKKKKKVLCSFSYLSPSIFSFSPPLLQFPFFSSPFPIFSLFSLPLFFLSSSFSISLPFFLFSSLFQNFPQTFQGWATRPPLVMPLGLWDTMGMMLFTKELKK